MEIGLNLEFIRSSDKSFREGIGVAAELGYKYVEPCVAPGYDLIALGGYYHTLSMEDDPLEVKQWLDELGLKASAVSAHSPLMRPEVSVPYLTQAIRYASDLGAPCVTTDEGLKPDWMSQAEAFDIMRYSIHQVMQTAERYGITVGLEPHRNYSVQKDTFIRMLELSDSPCWKANWDTGNFYLGGKDDPYESLEAVADRLCHVHAKDISIQQSESQRGEVTGTAVGCACGDGVVDWPRVIDILKRHGYDGVVSVECGTPDQAQRSLECLRGLIPA
ncbi:MAG: sugar phosphate isomerase/epimerase [Thermoguttaceae bacterium]